MIQKTTPITSHLSTIITLWLRNRAYRQVASQYHISYKCITVLLTCYLYSCVVKDKFTFTNIYKLLSAYKYHILSIYMNELIRVEMITLAGSGTFKYYKLTELGYNTIQGISVKADELLYEYCNKYNIEL